MASGSRTYEGVPGAQNTNINAATESAGSRTAAHRRVSPFSVPGARNTDMNVATESAGSRAGAHRRISPFSVPGARNTGINVATEIAGSRAGAHRRISPSSIPGARNTGINVATENAGSRAAAHRRISPFNGAQRGVTSNAAVRDLLECPVCTNIMYPPILQCPNGHTLCSECRSKVQCCPICRQRLGNIRCLALEQVAESLELPCQYQNLGCQEIFQYNGRLRHEQNCRFRPYKCPYAVAECSIRGSIPFLMAHLRRDHLVNMHNGSTFHHKFIKFNLHGVENSTWKLTVFNCYGHQFCLHFEAFTLGITPAYMAFIRFMGNENDASKFRYCLAVGGNERKMTWRGVPRSIRDSHLKVRDDMDGLIIQKSRLVYFLEGNEQQPMLTVVGHIWKEAAA